MVAEQLGQLVKLAIFLLPPGLGRILDFSFIAPLLRAQLDPAVLQARGAAPWLQRRR